MEDINDYWKVLDYPPLFTTVDWNENQPSSTHNTFIPMEINQQKIAPPFQRRRSSSVDLPVNPFYSNRFNNNLTIQEEERPIIKQEEIDALDLSTSTNNLHVVSNTSPSLSTCSSNNKDEHITSTSSLKDHNVQQPQIKIQYPPSPPTSQQQKTLITSTYFPELPRTSFHDLGKQLRQHTKRRRSSSLPPAFHATNKHQQKPPAPIVFTQIQVTDPTPIQHTQKAAKVEVPPIAIERVPKKKAQQMNESTIPIDPILKQKKLDEKLIRLNFDDVTVAELKEVLKERGLCTIGKKAILIHRLKDARNQLLTRLKPPTPPRDHLTISASPAIQGLADMTIHSPNLFSPIIEDSSNLSTTSSSSYNTAIDHQLQNGYENDMNINNLFDFDTILDSNAILFPPSQQDQEQRQGWSNHNNTTTNPSTTDWNQDTLEHFLADLV